MRINIKKSRTLGSLRIAAGRMTSAPGRMTRALGRMRRALGRIRRALGRMRRAMSINSRMHGRQSRTRRIQKASWMRRTTHQNDLGQVTARAPPPAHLGRRLMMMTGATGKGTARSPDKQKFLCWMMTHRTGCQLLNETLSTSMTLSELQPLR